MKDDIGMAFFDMVKHQDEIPEIAEPERMTPTFSDTITYHFLRVYDAFKEELRQWES
ncbi:MAG: hypothetical protein PHI01_03160 [Candidatus Izemoplasmatales bacterium]|nr:hypothetical protein [Candidatus Izemoplasmatales bacterium]